MSVAMKVSERDVVDIIRETLENAFDVIAQQLAAAPEHVTARQAGERMLEGRGEMTARLTEEFEKKLREGFE